MSPDGARDVGGVYGNENRMAMSWIIERDLMICTVYILHNYNAL